jgi:GMP synthase (glutamine-hydrolysing)
MPPGFVVAGTSANAPFAVIQDEKRKYYGLMFHPEVVHTPDGAKLIRNFVRKAAGLTGDWTMRAFREIRRVALAPRLRRFIAIVGHDRL